MKPLIIAYLGGLIANCVRLMELQKTPIAERPITFRDPLYTFQFFVMPAIGSFLVYLYTNSGSALTPFVSFHIGVSAPLIIKQMITTIPTNLPQID